MSIRDNLLRLIGGPTKNLENCPKCNKPYEVIRGGSYDCMSMKCHSCVQEELEMIVPVVKEFLDNLDSDHITCSRCGKCTRMCSCPGTSCCMCMPEEDLIRSVEAAWERNR